MVSSSRGYRSWRRRISGPSVAWGQRGYVITKLINVREPSPSRGRGPLFRYLSERVLTRLFQEEGL